jgi:4'-phosphopantetheinyl transferase
LVEKTIRVGKDYSEWSKGNCLYNPNANFIDLWRVDISNPELNRHQECLSSDEHQRADKFILENIRNTFVRSRCALRLVLARCLAHQAPTQARAIEFRYGNQGKPELASPAVDDFQFNLSHSADIALIAVAKGRRVGVDVYNFSQSVDWRPIAKRSFSTYEISQLAKLPDAIQEKAFHKIWTQKEAYTKAIGDGYAYGFQAFSVVVDSDGSSGLLNDDSHSQSDQVWNITSVNAGGNCVAALAYEGTPVTKIRQWEFCIDWS